MIDLECLSISVKTVKINQATLKKSIVMELIDLDTGLKVIKYFNLKKQQTPTKTNSIEENGSFSKLYRLTTGNDIKPDQYKRTERLFSGLVGARFVGEFDEKNNAGELFGQAKKIAPKHPYFDVSRWSNDGTARAHKKRTKAH